MAKYIRTKYEIGTFGGFRHNDFTGEVYTKVFNSHGTYREYTNIVAESDNIEDLCDEFVAVSKDNKYRSLVKIEETGNRWVEDKITQWCEILKNKLVNWTIYGAIWTDKGLIYVAKMNDKGELELLCEKEQKI